MAQRRILTKGMVPSLKRTESSTADVSDTTLKTKHIEDETTFWKPNRVAKQMQRFIIGARDL
jgi:hypothetical protein